MHSVAALTLTVAAMLATICASAATPTLAATVISTASLPATVPGVGCLFQRLARAAVSLAGATSPVAVLWTCYTASAAASDDHTCWWFTSQSRQASMTDAVGHAQDVKNMRRGAYRKEPGVVSHKGGC